MHHNELSLKFLDWVDSRNRSTKPFDSERAEKDNIEESKQVKMPKIAIENLSGNNNN